MWATVAARKHTVHQVFPYGVDAREVMLHGTVHYTLVDGTQNFVEWAGRATLRREGDNRPWKFAYYQVYLVSLAQKRTDSSLLMISLFLFVLRCLLLSQPGLAELSFRHGGKGMWGLTENVELCLCAYPSDNSVEFPSNSTWTCSHPAHSRILVRTEVSQLLEPL